MASTKISALSAAATLDGTEQVPVVQSGATVRTTVALLNAQSGAITQATSAPGSPASGDLWLDTDAAAQASAIPAWATYSPTNTNITVGNGTQTAFWVQSGSIAYVRYSLVWGSGTSFGGVIQIGLPTAAKASTLQVGAAYLLDSGTQHYPAIALIGEASASTMNIHHPTSSGSGDITASNPFVWTTGDKLIVTATYEVA